MTSPASQPDQSRTWIGLLLVWLVVFGGIFYSQTLPNDASGLTRTDVWLALPDIVYFNCVSNPEGGAAGWRFLPQRLPLIGVGLWILCGAWGYGELLLRGLTSRVSRKLMSSAEPSQENAANNTDSNGYQFNAVRLERFVIVMGLGLAAVSLLMLSMGLMAQSIPGVMNRIVLGTSITVPAVVAMVLVGVDRRVQQAAPSSCNTENDPWLTAAFRGGQIPFHALARGLTLTVIALFVLTMVLGSLLPSIDFDVKEYHLGGPKEWFQTGSIHFLPHNVYTSFPFLTEMLLLLGMVLTNDWYWGASAGQFVLAMFGILSGLTVFAAGRRWFGERAAWMALLIHLSTPWTYRISVIAYAEGGLTFYLIATFFAVLLAFESRQHVWVAVAGLLAGSGMACKYPGVVSVVLPLGAALVVGWHRHVLKTQALKVGLIYSVGVCVAVGPWLLKNYSQTGNPIYPLLNSIFHGIDWNAALEAHWKRAHSPSGHDPYDILVKLFDVTCKSDWLSPLLFAFAPAAMLAVSRRWGCRPDHDPQSGSVTTSTIEIRRRIVIATSVFVGFQFASWWILTHRIDRFWVPLIPLVSLLAGIGVGWSTHRTWTIAARSFIAAGVLFNLAFITLPNCGFNAFLSDFNELPEKTATTAPGIAAIHRLKLPLGSKVLLVGEAQIFDAQFPLVYNTVFDVSIFEQWCSANVPDLPVKQQPFKPIKDIQEKLAAEGITHVFVNWSECLRYRVTGYGGSDFVEPERFYALCEADVLRLVEPAFTGVRLIETFRADEVAEIQSWAPRLVVETSKGPGFINGQWFEVRRQ